MNEALKKFSVEAIKDLKNALIANRAVDLMSKIKAAADAAAFKVVISTADEDRQGDAIDQTKWKLDNYEANPVVLWAHDYYEPPIGVCTRIAVENGKLVAEGKFASADLNPFAAQIAAMYEAGFIKATSVGYMQHEDGTLELLEFSFVPVPANPYALSMRDIKNLNLNIPQLVMKGLSFAAKAEKPGDRCELDDGTPGVLSDDPDDPGELVCVPEKSAADDQNNLVKAVKAEHDRHGKAVAKAIDEFGKKAVEAQPEELDKEIQEFKSATDAEHEGHLQKCMKAIDENYELQDQRKGIDEFKSAMKAAHEEHVLNFHKAIDEFKKDWPDGDPKEPKEKAIEEFGKKSAAELARHEKAQMDLCKAEMGQGEDDGKGIKALIEAALKSSSGKSEWSEQELTQLLLKVGRQISAKNKEKINSVIKAIEEFKSASAAAHEKHSNDVIAALRDLIGPDGGEGEEPGKSGAPNSRSSTSGAATKDMDELETFLLVQRLVRQVETASEGALRQINEKVKQRRRSS